MRRLRFAISILLAVTLALGLTTAWRDGGVIPNPHECPPACVVRAAQPAEL